MDAIRPYLDASVLRVWPRPTWPRLPVLLLNLRLHTHAQPAAGLLPLQDCLPCLVRLAISAERPPSGRLQSLQTCPCPRQPQLALCPILVALLRAAVPQDSVALLRTLRTLDAVVHDFGVALPPW